MPTAKKEAVQAMPFDQQIVSSVVKQVLTPAKVTELATKMAPAIEKQFAASVTKFVETMFEDNWRLAEFLQDDKVIRDALLVGLRKAVGVEEKQAKMIKPSDSRSRKKMRGAGQTAPALQW